MIRSALVLVSVFAFASIFGTSAAGAYVDWLPVFERGAVQERGHGQLPPCGQPKYEWTDVDVAHQGEDVAADANPTTCTIRWDLGSWKGEPYISRDPGMMCLTEFHEMNHLYGAEHSPDPLNIMYSGPNFALSWMDYPPCRRLIKSIVYASSGVPKGHTGLATYSIAYRPAKGA